MASGTLTKDNIVCHGVNLGTNDVRVSVNEVINLSTMLHVTTFGVFYICEVQGTFVA